MELRELTNEEFKSFTDKYSLHSMYQSVEYGLVMNNQKYTSIFVGLINDIGDIVAASLLLIEKLGQFKYAYAPRGFLIDYTDKELLTEFSNQIKKFLKKKSVIAVKISPLIARNKITPSLNISLSNPSYDIIFNNLKELKYYHHGYNNFFEAFKPRFVAIANLESDTNKMFNLLSQDIKEKINECDLAGVRIFKGNENNLEFVYEDLRDKKKKSKEYVNDLYKYFNETGKAEVYFAQLDTKLFLVNTRTEYQKQVNVCNQITDDLFKNQGKSNNAIIEQKIQEENKLALLKNQLVYATNLLRNNPNGIIVASTLVIKHHNQIYITLDGENEEYKHLCPKYILYWKLMEKYATEGYKELYLGGITNPNYDGENEFKELNEFKLGFNGSCIEYSGDFELITHSPFYMLYRNGAPFRKLKKQND